MGYARNNSKLVEVLVIYKYRAPLVVVPFLTFIGCSLDLMEYQGTDWFKKVFVMGRSWPKPNQCLNVPRSESRSVLYLKDKVMIM